MRQEARESDAALGLDALEDVTEAIASGSGLPEVARAAARALDASLVVIDRSGHVLAETARSPAERRSLAAEDVQRIELRVAETVTGEIRLRPRGEDPPAPAMLRLVAALVASEVERVRGPERSSEEAALSFQRAVLGGRIAAWEDLIARGHELGLDLSGGGVVIVARAHAHRPADADWRRRLSAAADRAARAVAPGAITAPVEPGSEQTTTLLADRDGTTGRRAAEALLRELEASLPGFSFAVGRSSVGRDPTGLRRAGHEAQLAANVGDAGESAAMAYEELGTYRILLPVLMEDPAELERFYAETLEPIVAYDLQYDTDLVGTLGTFLDCDANVNATAARLITHRHTVRYRLERVRELSGLDVGSTDGREKLSLGLKAMRVLGLAAPRGPASERGAAGGRVKRRSAER